MSMEKLDKLYEIRFSKDERAAKDAIWSVLCRDYFQQFVAESDTVLDIACGYGEFIRHIKAKHKLAADLNGAVAAELPSDVKFFCSRADQLSEIASGSVDVCFVSNFFEHLEDKRAMDAVLREIHRVLRPAGRFVCMQPNIRYSGGQYWDFYDHVLPLSHLSMAEALEKSGFELQQVVPRFVPFTTKSAYPKHPIFVRLYLHLRFLWPLLGGQFVIVASKT